MSAELAQAIQATAGKLGIDPVDLATAISYETAGTFDPWKAGPTTKWGQHRGLIQWGEPQRQKYGVSQDMPVPAQVEAAGQYLVDAGVKPGMGLMDIYSAINAGRVGLYNRSDAHAGGAPGTVADKVNTQMGGHRKKAEALLGGMMAQAQPAPVSSQNNQISAPTAIGSPIPPQGGLLAQPAATTAPQGLAPQPAAQQGLLGGDMSPEQMQALMAPPKPLQHLEIPMTRPKKAGFSLRG
jgi:hypothetical protein